MLKLKISKKDLLLQLPHHAGNALIQWYDEMPLYFVFEGIEHRDNYEILEEREPELRKILTPKEWQIFNLLYWAKGMVPYRSVFAVMSVGKELSPNSNIVQVHVKNLRNKLSAPYAIKTHRGVGYELLGKEK